jgi:hypothetical protein
LIILAPFRLPTDPSPVAVYACALPPHPVRNADGNLVIDNLPLTRPEIATIDAEFLRCKNYYRLMIHIKRACFDAIDACINDKFKVSNDPTIVGWHAGMSVMDILNGLSMLYGKPTPAVLEGNNTKFRSPYLPANPPAILFQCIEDCAKIALLEHDPYTDWQLINMQCIYLHPPACTSVPLRIGTFLHQSTKHGLHSML